jgi:hypothetical protein
MLNFVGAEINWYWSISFHCPLSYSIMSLAPNYLSTFNAQPWVSAYLATQFNVIRAAQLHHGFPSCWRCLHENLWLGPQIGWYLQLKACSLVCIEWHLLLWPLLFLTLTLDILYVHAHENDKRMVNRAWHRGQRHGWETVSGWQIPVPKPVQRTPVVVPCCHSWSWPDTVTGWVPLLVLSCCAYLCISPPMS